MRFTPSVGRLAAAIGAVPVVATFVVVSGLDAQAAEQVQAFEEAGTYQFEVPAGVTCVDVVVAGAAGGRGQDFDELIGSPPTPGSEGDGGNGGSLGGEPGLGGRTSAELIVTPGEVLQVNVGGVGTDATGDRRNGEAPEAYDSAEGGGSGGIGGFNGGGYGGSGGGGGGGASDIRQGGTALDDRVVVGAGGGGGGDGGPALEEVPDIDDSPATEAPGEGFTPGSAPGGAGGHGGGLDGTAGGDGFLVAATGGEGGGGGSQTAGGAAGADAPVADADPATAGAFGVGGDGANAPDSGAGGGGGWYGGGGGGGGFYGTGGGGGGGSSYGPAAAEFVSGDQAGDGLVVLTYEAGDTSCDADVDDDDVVDARPGFTG